MRDQSSTRHTASMAVALWVLGDTEDEVEAELIRRGLRPAGRMLPATGRARWMQRVEGDEEAATVNDATPADSRGGGRPGS